MARRPDCWSKPEYYLEPYRPNSSATAKLEYSHRRGTTYPNVIITNPAAGGSYTLDHT